MPRTKRPPYHEYMKLIRRFNMALASGDRIEKLTANMLGAIAVTMNELTPDQIEEVRRLVDQNHVRVFQP